MMLLTVTASFSGVRSDYLPREHVIYSGDSRYTLFVVVRDPHGARADGDRIGAMLRVVQPPEHARTAGA